MERYLESLKQFGAKIQEIWSKLNLNQKILFAGAALLLIAASVFFFLGSSQTPYEILYTELDPKEASTIVAKLEESKIDYTLEDNGTTILVSPEVKYSTRLKLAGENLPRSESGFEMFQTNNFGETQTDKQVKYQVALQGELARTIQSLEKVKSARVHLVLPEKSLYTEKEEKPSASVAITTREDNILNTKEIQGIINLVSNSVEGLDPEKVVIIDHNGKLISENLEEQGTETETLKTQLAMKKEFEKEKQQAIQSMLDMSLGKNNSVVRVSAELNFNDKEDKSVIHTHDPEGPFVISERTIKESGTNTQTNPAGVPGTDTNIQQYTQVNPTTGNSTYDKSDKTSNYELNTTETATKYAPGEAKYDYLTVAVLVNNTAASKLKMGNTDQEREDKIRNIVATACGLRENRPNETVNLKDNISVAFIDFYSEPIPEPTPTGMQKLLQSPWGLALIGLLALALAFTVGLLIRRKKQKEELALIEAQEILEPGFEAAVEEEISLEDLIDKKLTPEEREKQRIKHEVEKLIDENPENAAQVLKTWLLEDQR